VDKQHKQGFVRPAIGEQTGTGRRRCGHLCRLPKLSGR
jgi:hypothetical protein